MKKETIGKVRNPQRHLLVLPLLVLPFMTMAFWSLGGGRGEGVSHTKAEGLNFSLPESRGKDLSFADKLALYEKADKDSQQVAGWKRSDPYYREAFLQSDRPLEDMAGRSTLTDPHLPDGGSQATVEADALLQKLQVLQQQLDKPAPASTSIAKPDPPELFTQQTGVAPAIRAQVQEDPQLRQLEGMLDKILQIRQPAEIMDSSFDNDEPSEVTQEKSDSDSLVRGDGFLGWDDSGEDAGRSPGVISAELEDGGVISSGSPVRIRLLEDYKANQLQVAAGTIIAGVARLSGDRLFISVTHVREGNSLLPVRLTAFDMDGMEGLYVPGLRPASSRQVWQEPLGSLEKLAVNSSSIPAAAADGGIREIKNMFQKKQEGTRVLLQAGYPVLLMHQKTGK